MASGSWRLRLAVSTSHLRLIIWQTRLSIETYKSIKQPKASKLRKALIQNPTF